ncbi:MAG TPA: M14 family zinc carboxypeptidase [Bacteroidales bacterium]|nr:zinc carboxypeptidase [Bacteroidales bacterium]HNR42287.1 M14 family zinc carboxypeptidase [Bacteroidales bacterium]HPM19493.1 M14 family zinc carboxypeptidase [Bacteroidales bacterium]
MREFVFIFLISTLISVNIFCQPVKSPDEFLGYELGTQFTFHHRAVDYFRYIAGQSECAEIIEYGTTYEGRPLCVCVVSEKANLAILDQYRNNNLIKAGLVKGDIAGSQLPIIWLAYNIHGNEAAGMETAMKTLYTLVSGSFPGSENWLRSCIIIIDPCQNPDGHELYVNRYRSSQNLHPNADGNSWEHNQGWPGARTNHYFFDLNRDWAWQTQVETVERLTLYRKFMPHVYADFHEMGSGSTFFFAPGADPWHEAITPWQRKFHEIMGKGNAALFDEKSKLYFTKEHYDLFFPAYSDTWPLFNGAAGFTYEQGGSGYAGLALRQESEDTLTLKKRIDGHFTASMATLKVSYENREKLIAEFNTFFRENAENPAFEFKSIIIKGSNDKTNLNDLLLLLDRNQIRYSPAGNTGKKYRGFDYLANVQGETTIEAGDILVSAFQPQARLVKVLFEPDSRITDSLSYDLTAWALPYTFNVKAFAIREKIVPGPKISEKNSPGNMPPQNPDPYAYLVNFSGFSEMKLVSALQEKNIKVRHCFKPFSVNGTSFERGSYIITKADNRIAGENLDRIVTGLAGRLGVVLKPVSTGLVDEGKDLGSDYSPLLKKKKIALLCGDGTSSGAVGEIWYFFEREVDYPVTVINTSNAERTDLTSYDVLILAGGSYSKLNDIIIDFARKGGRVIALENSISVFASEKSTSLYKDNEARKTELKASADREKNDASLLLRKFEDERRYFLSERSAGSIYRVRIDSSHPYGFGLGNEWFVIKGSSSYPLLSKGSNVGYIPENDPVAGFAGYKFRKQVKNTLVIGTEKIGEGEVVYIADNPYFRAYWKSGRILLWNVIFR